MTSTYSSDTPPIEPTERPMFAAPLYARRKAKADRTRNLIMAGAGVIALVAAVGVLVMARGDGDEIAAVETTAPAATLARPTVAPEPAVALPPQTAITQPVVTAPPPEPARAPTRVARAAPRRATPAPVEAAPSADTTATNVSATVPEVMTTPPAALPIIPPINLPSTEPAV